MKFAAAYWFGLSCLLMCNNLAADGQQEALERIARKLSVENRIEGHFRQEKHLAFMQNPIVSEGDFSLSRSDGLIWRVVTPVSSLMTVQGSEVLLDGERIQDHGIGRLMSRLMLGFMEGELSGMARLFDIGIEDVGDGWRLELQPRSERMRLVFEQIDLSGGQYLQVIDLHENGGNQTLITFCDVRAVTDPE